jgi:tyrosine-protein phosphatase YwqE
MFSFFSKKKNLEIFPFHRLETDMHSHLLPGIDDGSPDVETSIRLIQGLEDLGYKQFITTPHAMEDLYPNNRSTIQAAYDTLKNELKTQKKFPRIRFAAEYLLDGNVDTLLEKKEPMLTLKDKIVLVEISFASQPIYLKEILFNLQMNGYQPIFAHPERYSFYHHQPSYYAEIKAMGCLFQSNLLSFSGYYGGSVKQAAEYLVNQGLTDYLGTDLHHDRHLENLRELPFTPALAKLIDEKGVLNHLL